jgi:hypothetical protein
MSDHMSDWSDENLGRRLATELPRHAAPARLRAAVAGATGRAAARPAWRLPVFASAATAMIAALLFITVLPRGGTGDPLDRVLRAVVAEHTRTILWGSRTVLNADEQSGIRLLRRFDGNDRLNFVNTEPVYIDRRLGMALHYRDVDDHLITYIVLPGQGLSVPDRRRVQVDRFRPAVWEDSGFATIAWKQTGFMCLLVSDMVSPTDLARFKQYFLTVRSATEPAS